MSKKEALLKAAENKVRLGGYSNFSFRELANEVGIKSASVHYHFPTKADLGAELAHQYTDAFLLSLGEPAELKAQGKNPIDFYTSLFRGALVTKNPLRGGLSLSWSQGAPGRLAVGTVDGSVCVFDIHRCMQYDIENNVNYSKSSNEKHFAHVPTITVTMEEAGPIRDLEFAPLEDEDENREDEKSVEDDIKRKRLASANFIAVAAHKVSKANVIDLRSRSVLPESFQIEKWMDDIRSVAWLPKGAYIYGCDGTVGFNGKFLLRQYDGPICWEDDEQEVRYGGTVGIKLPAADDILKDIKNE